MTRPAAPKSETPETDAAIVIGDGVIGPRTQTGFQIKFELNKEWVFADLARSLERRLSLAQTEIKGHMRVEDELKAEIQQQQFDKYELARIHVLNEAGLQERIDKAQAHIAELEKVLREIAGSGIVEHWRQRIDAVLKDRA